IVVKVGTSTLTDAQGCLDRGYIADLAAQLAGERLAGREVILVTSGAIGVGRDTLRRDDGDRASLVATSLPFKQAAAAVGQVVLMATYTEAFAWRNMTAAQVLLTREDLADRKRFLNARNTLTALLTLGVVPVINENDTVAVDEIKFGDNDSLAALVAVLVEADLLLILSDVEGLYSAPPDPNAESDTPPTVIRRVKRIDAGIEALAGGSGGALGTGGMRTKLEAARIATVSGIRTVIASGRRERVIADVAAGQEVGTTFLAGAGKLHGRKRWIIAGSRPRGSVVVNAGAAQRLLKDGVSLLAVGVTTVNGEFASGDLIEVRDETGRRFARGLTNYGAEELRLIQGLHSDQFEAVLGAKPYDEVIDLCASACPQPFGG
ncbi:MAG: glutamate 5-kinase, partial [Methanobacterium paludis]|nr:glutamate 5-kinase [Methanobacterium paludis]